MTFLLSWKDKIVLGCIDVSCNRDTMFCFVQEQIEKLKKDKREMIDALVSTEERVKVQAHELATQLNQVKAYLGATMFFCYSSRFLHNTSSCHP